MQFRNPFKPKPKTPSGFFAEILRDIVEDRAEGFDRSLLFPSHLMPETEPSEQIVALRDYFGVPWERPPFKIGDVCRPKPHSFAHGIKIPHLVIEVLAEPIFYAPQGAEAKDEQPTFSKCWGQRLDMRVLHMAERGEIHAHWVESWTFEAWPDE